MFIHIIHSLCKSNHFIPYIVFVPLRISVRSKKITEIPKVYYTIVPTQVDGGAA